MLLQFRECKDYGEGVKAFFFTSLPDKKHHAINVTNNHIVTGCTSGADTELFSAMVKKLGELGNNITLCINCSNYRELEL